jgi:glucose-6-phosphate dehydrogenase assembly protein OpcA
MTSREERQRSANLAAKKVTRWREATAEALASPTSKQREQDQNGFRLSPE